jgi:3-dehydroquinate synthetase
MPDDIRAAMFADKKKVGGRLKFALPKCIGDVEYNIDVDPNLLTEVLEMITHGD